MWTKKISLNMDTNKIRRCVAARCFTFDLAIGFGVRKSKMLHRMLREYGKRMQQHNIDEFSMQQNVLLLHQMLHSFDQRALASS